MSGGRWPTAATRPKTTIEPAAVAGVPLGAFALQLVAMLKRPAQPSTLPASGRARPSVEAGTALVLALTYPRQPAWQVVQHAGRPAMEVAGVLRIVGGADGTAILCAQLAMTSGLRSGLLPEWAVQDELEGYEILDVDALIERARVEAAKVTLARTCAELGLTTLAPEQRLYCERRLRQDLFSYQRSDAAARDLRRRLLREVLDRSLIRAALLIFGPHARYQDLNDCARAGAANVARITAESPQLAPLLASRVRAHARKGRPTLPSGAVGQIRRTLMASDPTTGAPLSAHGWRWLTRQSRATVALLAQAGETGCGSLQRLAVELFAAGGIGTLPAPLLQLARAGGPLERVAVALEPGAGRALRHADLARLLRLIGCDVARRQGSGQSLRHVADDAAYLLDWWLDATLAQEQAGATRPAPVIPPNATWSSLMRHQQRWHQLMIQRQPEHLKAWECLAEPHRIGPVQVVPLTDSLMLAREGMEMRHCVASYADDCARGGARIFALEDCETGARATLELRRRAWAWLIGQIKGPCNAPAAPSLLQAAERLAERYGQGRAAR